MSEHEPYVSAKDYRDLAAEVNKLTVERDDWRERAGAAGIRRERAEALHLEELGRINRSHADAIAGIGVTLDQAQRNSQSWEKRALTAEADLEAFKDRVTLVITATGDGIANMLDQLTKGNWVDDHGHEVKMNVQMLHMQSVLANLGQFREVHLGFTSFEIMGFPV